MHVYEFALFLSLACSGSVAIAEWHWLRRRHRGVVAEMRSRHRSVEKVTGEMLVQCRRQVVQLQSELAEATARAGRTRLALHQERDRRPLVPMRLHLPAVELSYEHSRTFADTQVDDSMMDPSSAVPRCGNVLPLVRSREARGA